MFITDFTGKLTKNYFYGAWKISSRSGPCFVPDPSGYEVLRITSSGLRLIICRRDVDMVAPI